MAALSLDLLYERRPDVCQSCGLGQEDTGLIVWQEMDANDRPQTPMRLLVLCEACSEELIEPHARLYEQVAHNAPVPGAMLLCVDCLHRRGLDCGSHLLRANGGAGMEITCARPYTYFVDGRRSNGRRWGKTVKVYASPPSRCAGREVREPDAVPEI
jgi:hypothetical protein